MRTAHAAVLREANPAVGWELDLFDLAHRCLDQPTKLKALFRYSVQRHFPSATEPEAAGAKKRF